MKQKAALRRLIGRSILNETLETDRRPRILSGGLTILLFAICSFPSALQAREIYQNGRYTVRTMEETCKLEIALYASDRVYGQGSGRRGTHGGQGDVIAFLGVFPSDDYFGELITSRERIGKAKKGLAIRFDGRRTHEISIHEGDEGQNDHWRWRYIVYRERFLKMIRKSRAMEILFSNGRHWFRFRVPLKGSARAVRKLKACGHQR